MTRPPNQRWSSCMPENARRRRSPAQRRSDQPARRNASRNAPRSQGRRPRPAHPAPPSQPEPYAELDQALTEAGARPEPGLETFDQLGLPEQLIQALAKRDIEAPFAIQRRALPDALAGRDVLGRAQTGSGKTLAFGLPLLARLASDGAGEPGRRHTKAPRRLVLV